MITFNQADRHVFSALMKMKHPEMVPLLKFFDNLSRETDVALRRAKPDDVQRLQGRAQLIEEFLTAVDSSAEVLDRMR